MIHLSLEKGTMVRHNTYGHGLFVKFFKNNPSRAIVHFNTDDYNTLVYSEDLNEVV